MKAIRWLAVAILVAGTVALAQDNPPGPPPGKGPGSHGPAWGGGKWNEGDARQMVETLMVARLSRELGLNDEQTVLMVRRLEEGKEKMAQLKKDRAEMVKALRDAVAAGAQDPDVEAKTQALIEADRKLSDGRFEVFEAARQGLSPAQAAKLYVFMGDFENDMRKLVQRARQRADAMRGEIQGGPPEGPEPPGQVMKPGRERGPHDGQAPLKQGRPRPRFRNLPPEGGEAPPGPGEPGPPPPPPGTE